MTTLLRLSNKHVISDTKCLYLFFLPQLWNMKQETWLHDLREHTGDIYTLQWSSTGPGSSHPNANVLLAT